MRKSRWVRLVLSMMVLCLVIPGSMGNAAGNVEYVTIQELYDQTRDGWKASYTTPAGSAYGSVPEGHVVQVDVPVKVPPVNMLPIVELVINKNICQDETVDSIPGQIREDGWIDADTLPDYESVEAIFFDPFIYPEAESGQPNGNGLTPQEAENFFYTLASKYFGVDNFRMRGQIAFASTPSEALAGGYIPDYNTTLKVAP